MRAVIRPLHPVDQFLTLLSQHGRGYPRLGRTERDDHGGHDEPGREPQFGLEGPRQPRRTLRLAPGRGFRVALVETVVHHVRQQRHGSVRARGHR